MHIFLTTFLEIAVYIYLSDLNSLKRGQWVFAWRRAQPGAQKCRGLDVLVGTAG